MSGFWFKLKMISQNLVSILNSLCYKYYRDKLINWVSRYSIWWATFHWVGPFVILNLMSDIVNIKNHYIWGSLSLLLIIIFGMTLIITKFHIVSPVFILKIDPIHPYIYTYGCFIKMVVHSMLVLFGDSTNFNALFAIAFWINILVLLIQSLE